MDVPAARAQRSSLAQYSRLKWHLAGTRIRDDSCEDYSDDFNHVHIVFDLSEVDHTYVCDDGSVAW